MESIGNALARTEIHRPPLQQARNCEVHGNYTALCHIGNRWTKCPTCTAEAQAREEQAERDREAAEALDRWQKRVEGAGIPERFRDRRFKTYIAETREQQEVLSITRAYAEDWEAVSKNGRCLILSGSRGTGKNHLACAIGMTVMHKHRASVLFETVQRAIRRVRDTWVKGSAKRESDAIAELVEPALLILDEVGVQSGSDFEQNILFDVLNERYLKRRPTILLTNLMGHELPKFLGERVMDRLREDGGEIVTFNWESYREKLGNTRDNT